MAPWPASLNGALMDRLPQRAALSGQILSISLRVTVVEEDVVSLMRRRDGASVLDRAPILLGASRHFPHVCDQSVGVAAEGAVTFSIPFKYASLCRSTVKYRRRGTRGMP